MTALLDNDAPAAVADWRALGACTRRHTSGDLAGQLVHDNPDRWYPVGNTTEEAREDIEYAKRVCWTECPIRAECLQHALDVREKHGVWGGLTEDERAAILRRQARLRRGPI